MPLVNLLSWCLRWYIKKLYMEWRHRWSTGSRERGQRQHTEAWCGWGNGGKKGYESQALGCQKIKNHPNFTGGSRQDHLEIMPCWHQRYPTMCWTEADSGLLPPKFLPTCQISTPCGKALIVIKTLEEKGMLLVHKWSCSILWLYLKRLPQMPAWLWRESCIILPYLASLSFLFVDALRP